MRPSLFMKSVLLLILLNGAASAQAASLTFEFSRMSHAGGDSEPQLGMLIEERAGGTLFTFSNALGVPSSITDIYFDDAQPALFSSIAYPSASQVGIAFDSQAASANFPDGNAIGFHADLSGGFDAGTADSYINQPNAVPLPAAAWLLSSALFGFVVVSNRRKV
jgi:hypothetical protein